MHAHDNVLLVRIMNDMILHTIQCSNLILFYCFIAGVYGFLFVPEGLFHFDFVDPPSPTGCLEVPIVPLKYFS